jgi:hypothetical protein
MEAKKVAHDADGNLSIVQVDGRSFVHGSILDKECAKRDDEIDRLKKDRDDLANMLAAPLLGVSKWRFDWRVFRFRKGRWVWPSARSDQRCWRWDI